MNADEAKRQAANAEATIPAAPPAGARQQAFAALPPHVQARLFYDGACPLCAREVGHYRRAKGSQNLAFVDIAAPSFVAADYGLDAAAVHRTLHVQTRAGEVATGIDAFAAIWRQLPRYRWLAPLMGLPLLRPLLRLAYAAFARVRPRLPGRRQAAACPANSCATPPADAP